VTDETQLDVRPKPDVAFVASMDMRDQFHIICNPFNNPFNRTLLPYLDRLGSFYGFQQSLPGLMSGRIGRLARAVAFRTVFRPALRRARFILCHGSFCRTYLQACGAPTERMFDSGYFVDPPDDLRPAGNTTGQPLKAVYVGQFIERKQILPFVAALPASAAAGWTLDLIGAGPQESSLRTLVAGRPCRVLPIVPYHQVMPTLSAYEVLVLPSRADEWGVVVNEAIHAGCAVITTEQCGSADLVRHGGCGVVVADARDCAEALVALAADRPRLERYRIAARELGPRITARSGADYLAAIVRHLSSEGPRPIPPWMSGTS